MAQRIIHIDDFDGSEPAQCIEFSLDGKDYEIDLSARNLGKLYASLKPFVERARPVDGSPEGDRGTSKTLFGALASEEKENCRLFLDMPKARRIGDAKIQEWIEAGRPSPASVAVRLKL